MNRFFRRCGHAPGVLSPADQAVVDAFRTLLAARKNPQPWTPGNGDVAVRIGSFIERAHPRPGDDHGPEVIAVSLIHPATPHASPYLHGCRLGYTARGWLRCETTAILSAWQPAYAVLTHAAADLSLPDDIGLAPAHYGVHVEARQPDGAGHTLLRLGPYTQIIHASRDADRLNGELEGQAATILTGFTVTAVTVPFVVSDHENYVDPYQTDVAPLLTTVAEVGA
ncbi:hypothetical protein [Streptomyces monomycini]|uniref:hypothetical protein n=1 Tax=Streptomyces monomycini TaxID=371720 RepID=UPI0004AB39C7|nr:hypothetical protein [Streptomyces monomycini]